MFQNPEKILTTLYIHILHDELRKFLDKLCKQIKFGKAGEAERIESFMNYLRMLTYSSDKTCKAQLDRPCSQNGKVPKPKQTLDDPLTPKHSERKQKLSLCVSLKAQQLLNFL